MASGGRPMYSHRFPDKSGTNLPTPEGAEETLIALGGKPEPKSGIWYTQQPDPPAPLRPGTLTRKNSLLGTAKKVPRARLL